MFWKALWNTFYYAAVSVPLSSRGDLGSDGKVNWRSTPGTPYVPTPLVLGDRLYSTQRNEAVLHTDTKLLPRARRAWAAWNYHVLKEDHAPVALTYNMNILQSLKARETFCVTLNHGAESEFLRQQFSQRAL